MKRNYNDTLIACFIGYVVQAIINNFVPLLFVTFQSTYQISVRQITLLVTFNFLVQLMVDLAAARFADRIGYRTLMLAAHLCCGIGLMGLTVLPELIGDAYIGLLIAVTIYAIGGGLLEVLVSPIVEACPTKKKEAAMSLLHSFYCWGHVGVVLLSTLYFRVFGISNWKGLALIWALIPLLNAINFASVPITSVVNEETDGLSMKRLFANKTFLLMLLLMLCAGASEQSISQWASAFCEEALGVEKAIGDLLGPLMFAALMGIGRLYYGKNSEKIKLETYMLACGTVCIVSYLVISVVPVPFLSLAGCGLCGFSVGVLWPGTFSLSAKTLPGGGTAMFALLALAGDLGCMSGPTVVGMVTSVTGNNLKMGILVAIVFPVILVAGLFSYR